MQVYRTLRFSALGPEDNVLKGAGTSFIIRVRAVIVGPWQGTWVEVRKRGQLCIAGVFESDKHAARNIVRFLGNDSIVPLLFQSMKSPL